VEGLFLYDINARSKAARHKDIHHLDVQSLPFKGRVAAGRERSAHHSPRQDFWGISVLRCYDENALDRPVFGPSKSVVQLDSFGQAFYNIQVDMPPGGALTHPPAGR
jgi:hypothetical protein